MARRIDETSQRRANQLRRAIGTVIDNEWLKKAGLPEVHITKSREQGATDAIIYEADVRLRFHIKDTLDATDDKKGYKILEEEWKERRTHLVPPIFEDVSGLDTIMLVPSLNAITLHDLIAGNKASDNWIQKLYGNFFAASEQLWTSSRSSVSCNLHDMYKKRITKRIPDLKRGLKKNRYRNLKVKINEREYETLGDSLDKFSNQIDRLKLDHSCTIHGDEHAKNIMVLNQAIGWDENGWVIIDYPNVRKNSDWIFSIAKMIHWWQFYYVIELAKGKKGKDLKRKLNSKWQVRKGTLHLDYDENELKKNIPLICSKLEEQTLNFVRKVAKSFHENQDYWQKRLNLALFSIIFGSMPLHFEKANFAIPIMIHKSLKCLESV